MTRGRPARTRFSPSLDRLEGRALMATAGKLDTTFGGGTGYVNLPITTQGDTTQGLLGIDATRVESDGSIVAVGPAEMDGTDTVGVLKLNADGTPDTSFGTDGVAYITPPSGATIGAGAYGASLLIQPGTGDIAVISTAGANSIASEAVASVVAMLNPDGTPDTSFGSGGLAILDYDALKSAFGLDAYFGGLAAFQPDGKLVLGGFDQINIPNYPLSTQQVVVARLNTDGTLDTSFAGQGIEAVASIPEADFTKVTMDPDGNEVPTAGEYGLGLAIQPSGQVVILTAYNDSDLTDQPQQSLSLIRLNTDGSVDTSLSQTGIRAIGASLGSLLISYEASGGLIAEPDGSLVALADGTLARINADGSLATTATLPAGVEAGSFSPLPDGGFALFDGSVYEFNPNLTLDTSYGNLGAAPVIVSSPGTGIPPYRLAGLAVGPDGQVVVFGANPSEEEIAESPVYIPPTYDVFARLTTTPTPATPGDFTGDGISDPAVFLASTSTFVIGNSSGGTSQVVQLGTPGLGNTIPAPGDYFATGQEDVAAYLADSGLYAIKDPSGETPGLLLPIGVKGVGQTLPAPGDYFGVGSDQVAVYLTQSATWDILAPGLKPGLTFPFGVPGVGNTLPVPGDYFGTGADDVAVYLPKTGQWSILTPGLQSVINVNFGIPGVGNSIPVPGDYDNSGHTELAVYLPALGELQYISARNTVVTISFGLSGAGQTLPEPGAFDGSGVTDAAAYFPSSNQFVYRPVAGADIGFTVGFASDGPILPVTAVVPLELLGTGSGSGSGTPSPSAIEAPGVMGEADALDFLIPIASDAKKPKPADS